MSMYSQFKTDEVLEQNGVVVEYADFRVTLARAGGANKQYNKALNAKTKLYERQISTRTIDPDVANRLVREVFAATVVKNWEVKTGANDEDGNAIWEVGIEGPDGDKISFTPENVIMTFVNLPSVFDDIQETANGAAIYRMSIREDDAGN